MELHDLIGIQDLDREKVLALLQLAATIKSNPAPYRESLRGRTGVLVFEKPSLRTRVTFEVAFHSMGGNAIYLAPADIGLGTREPIRDVARNLERWVDAIIARVFAHKTVLDLAEYSHIPVVNALSDREHPCQALGDYLTLQERFGDPARVRVAYIGDGNNVCASLMLMAATLGGTLAISTPSGYEPPREIVQEAARRAKQSGAVITLSPDPAQAVQQAQAVYTDVWTSMGQEDSAESRRVHFVSHQVNAELMARAAPDAVFMHCLPAKRGEEVTDEVMESSASAIFDQAENRLHAQKAVLQALIHGF